MASKLIESCDVEKVGWITYSQFKKLFFNVATTPGSLSPVVVRKVLPAAAKEAPPITMSNSLRLKLTTRPTFWSQFSADEEGFPVPIQIRFRY